MNSKIIVLSASLFILSACSEQKERQSDLPISDLNNQQELGDQKLTQALNQKLINATKAIGINQESKQESLNKNELKKLSEEDRQELIELTIQEGAKNIEQQADSVITEKETNARTNAINR